MMETNERHVPPELVIYDTVGKEIMLGGRDQVFFSDQLQIARSVRHTNWFYEYRSCTALLGGMLDKEATIILLPNADDPEDQERLLADKKRAARNITEAKRQWSERELTDFRTRLKDVTWKTQNRYVAEEIISFNTRSV